MALRETVIGVFHGLEKNSEYLCFVLAVGLSATSATAGLVTIHSGSADATSQGWNALPGSGGGVLVGGINDRGTDAWFVDDNSTGLNTIYLYERVVATEDISDGNALGWELTTSLRVACDEALTFDGSPVVSYRDGVRGWQMNFGLDASSEHVRVAVRREYTYPDGQLYVQHVHTPLRPDCIKFGPLR